VIALDGDYPVPCEDEYRTEQGQSSC
jgi:hypothetical protein